MVLRIAFLILIRTSSLLDPSSGFKIIGFPKSHNDILHQLLNKTIFYKKCLLYSWLKITRLTIIQVTLSLELEYNRFYLITCQKKKKLSNYNRTIYAWIQQFYTFVHYIWSGRPVKCYRLTHILYCQTLPFLLMKHQNG